MKHLHPMDDNTVVWYHMHAIRWLSALTENMQGIHPVVKKYIRKVHQLDRPSQRISNYNTQSLLDRRMCSLGIIDRTDQFNLFPANYQPIPEFDPDYNRDFDDLMIERAEQLWHDHGDITVSFSGGVDSTSAITALVKTKPASGELKLFGTASLLEENPTGYARWRQYIDIVDYNSFFDISRTQKETPVIVGSPGCFLQKGGVHLSPGQAATFSRGQTNALILDGEDIGYNRLWRDVAWHPVAENPDNSPPLTPTQTALERHIVEQIVAQAPFELKTFYDFQWWMIFCTRIEWGELNMTVARLLLADQMPTKINVLGTPGFFHTPEFQKWSMKNHSKKDRLDRTPYKYDAREFIKRHTGDAEYADNKSKINSMKLIPEYAKASPFNKTRIEFGKNSPMIITSAGTVYSEQNPPTADDINRLLVKHALKVVKGRDSFLDVLPDAPGSA